MATGRPVRMEYTRKQEIYQRVAVAILKSSITRLQSKMKMVTGIDMTLIGGYRLLMGSHGLTVQMVGGFQRINLI